MNYKKFSRGILGIEPITTLYDDFSLAEKSGQIEVRNICQNALDEWKNNSKIIAELVMVLALKSWDWCSVDSSLSSLYQRYHDQIDGWARNHFKGADLEYYVKVVR